jgi:hypothetical protein
MNVVEQVKQSAGLSYSSVCSELAVPYSSLMRWRSRRGAAEALVRKPGPAKVDPLDLDALRDEILRLDHGTHRTQGTGALYERHRHHISRRDLQHLVEATRREIRREAEALSRRIDWLVPGLVWSMDDTKKHWLEDRFGHVLLVMDLSSRYNLRAWGDDVQANGLHVALNLEGLFHRHGPPLFLKIDGGGNFKHTEVRDLLAAHGVIPLVSPPYYPPYNGGIERGHQELLRQLHARIGDRQISSYELRLEAEVSAHEVNHQPRPSLAGLTPCRALGPARAATRSFNRRKRKEAFDEITALTVDIARNLDDHSSAAAETAFRYAAETWMQSNHMIRVTQNGKVLPCFPSL